MTHDDEDDDSTVPGEDEAAPGPIASEDDVIAVIDAAREELDELLDQFPAAERSAAAWSIYVDADGRLRTRHRMLRDVSTPLPDPADRADPADPADPS